MTPVSDVAPRSNEVIVGPVTLTVTETLAVARRPLRSVATRETVFEPLGRLATGKEKLPAESSGTATKVPLSVCSWSVIAAMLPLVAVPVTVALPEVSVALALGLVMFTARAWYVMPSADWSPGSLVKSAMLRPWPNGAIDMIAGVVLVSSISRPRQTRRRRSRGRAAGAVRTVLPRTRRKKIRPSQFCMRLSTAIRGAGEEFNVGGRRFYPLDAAEDFA